MPVQKNVLPMSTVCVEKITQLLIEIVSTGNNPCKRVTKTRNMLDISSIKRDNIRGKLSHVTDRKKNEDGQRKEGPDSSSSSSGGGSSSSSSSNSGSSSSGSSSQHNGTEQSSQGAECYSCSTDIAVNSQVLKEGAESHVEQQKTIESSANLLNGNCSTTGLHAEQNSSDQQNTVQDFTNQEAPTHLQPSSANIPTDSASKGPHTEQNSSKTEQNSSDQQNTVQDSTNQEASTVQASSANIPPDSEQKISANAQNTIILAANSSLECQQEPSTSQSCNQGICTLVDCTQESPPACPDMVSGKQKRMIVLVGELKVLLESLSHAALHARLFNSVAAGLDHTYMRDKDTRGPIQEIISQFVNFALLEMDFGKLRMFSEATMCKVLFDNLDNATRLETLIIDRSCYWRTKIFDRLSDKLTKMPHLTVLKIQFICTPEMIQGLAEKCPSLCDLSVKGSEKITDEYCDELAKCKSLKSLDISGTRITGRGCWKILDSVKELSWLHHCAFNCNSDSLLFESRADLFAYVKEQLRRGQAEQTPPGQSPNLREATFSLRNFWLFNPFTSDLLTTTLCPNLTHLRLDFIFQDLQEEPDVDILASLTQLTKLEVNFYDRCSVDLVSQMITGCGPRLTNLHLHLADDWFFAAQVQNVVASCCPNLVSLTYTGDYRVRHSLEECDDKLDFELATPGHPNLQYLKIVGVVSDQRLRFLLLHCPSLVTLHLDGELEWLHDNTFTQALQLSPLHNLQELWFNVSTTVTFATVKRILRESNQIKTVGRLCHMAGSNMEEYHQLRLYIKQHNLDVKLIWVTDERALPRS